MKKQDNPLARYVFTKGKLAGRVLIFLLIVMSFVLSACPASVRGQMLGHSIGINPEYASPTNETPPGVEVNSASLVENANVWNGRTVTFTGEAIGESMIREKMAWVHLNDDAYMQKNIEEGGKFEGYNSGHAIWMPADMAQRILTFGDYKHKGDIIKVTGTFNAACTEHGGDMDIHASSLQAVKPGRHVEHRPDNKRIVLAAGLFLLAGLLYACRRTAERRRI